MKRWVLIGAGFVAVFLGMLGILLLVLPTTPFLLLAAACFLRSSERLNNWLLSNRVFGEYLRRYRSGEGMTIGSKIAMIVALWCSLGTTMFLTKVGERPWLYAMLALIGAGVTVHLLRIKTYVAGAVTGRQKI